MSIFRLRRRSQSRIQPQTPTRDVLSKEKPPPSQKRTVGGTPPLSQRILIPPFFPPKMRDPRASVEGLGGHLGHPVPVMGEGSRGCCTFCQHLKNGEGAEG